VSHCRGSPRVGYAFVGAIPSTNLRLLPSCSRHQPQADRSEQLDREAVPLRPRLSPSPRPGALGQLSVDRHRRLARDLSAPSPEKRPSHSIFVCPVVPPWCPASGVHSVDYPAALLPHIWVFLAKLTVTHAVRSAGSGQNFIMPWSERPAGARSLDHLVGAGNDP
jgi:hypothetical protein